jgi:hypothetical protein
MIFSAWFHDDDDDDDDDDDADDDDDVIPGIDMVSPVRSNGISILIRICPREGSTTFQVSKKLLGVRSVG